MTATLHHQELTNNPAFAGAIARQISGVAVLPNEAVRLVCLDASGRMSAGASIDVARDTGEGTLYAIRRAGTDRVRDLVWVDSSDASNWMRIDPEDADQVAELNETLAACGGEPVSCAA